MEGAMKWIIRLALAINAATFISRAGILLGYGVV
jgi:hypothetical protein